jgi:glycosyltransferase involved in cell wall biosynthesis
MIKVSIVIPVYNVLPYIERCLISVINQTYQCIECILVDDCGNDNSMDEVNRILNDYIGEIEFKVVRHSCNQGLSATRNTGIENATGEYLFFLDSDDELVPNSISDMIACCNKYGEVDIVVGNFSYNDSNEYSHSFKKEYYDYDEAKDVYLANNICIMVPNKLFKSAIVKRIPFKVGITNEDNLWSFFLSEKINKLCFINKVTYHYYMNPKSVTHSDNYYKKRIESFKIIYQELLAKINSKSLRRPYPLEFLLDWYVFGFVLMESSDIHTYDSTKKILRNLSLNHIELLNFRDKLKLLALFLPYRLMKSYSCILKLLLKFNSRTINFFNKNGKSII